MPAENKRSRARSSCNSAWLDLIRCGSRLNLKTEASRFRKLSTCWSGHDSLGLGFN